MFPSTKIYSKSIRRFLHLVVGRRTQPLGWIGLVASHSLKDCRICWRGFLVIFSYRWYGMTQVASAPVSALISTSFQSCMGWLCIEQFVEIMLGSDTIVLISYLLHQLLNRWPPPPPPMWSLFFLQVSETNVTTVDSTHISPRRSQSNPPPFLVKWNPGFDRHICVRLQSSVEKWSQKVSLLSFLIFLLVVNKISGESRLWAKERARFYFSRPAVLRSLISSFSAK